MVVYILYIYSFDIGIRIIMFYIFSNSRGNDPRSFKRSGRSTPTGKRSLPQTPTNYMSDGEMSDGGSSAIGSYINRLQLKLSYWFINK